MTMMTPELERIALQADFTDRHLLNESSELAKFAELVAAAEREACALVCEKKASDDIGGEGYAVGMSAANAIRARGTP